MKKKLFVIPVLVLALLMSMFTGCGEKEPEPLWICVDLEYAYGVEEKDEFFRENLNNLLVTRLLEAGNQKDVEVPRDFEIEYLPVKGAERDTALERIRTEIMAGGGPDVFIAACNPKNAYYVEALFTMPEKAMELAIFLPLDDYMEDNTQFSEWDRMNQTVLAAGRNEEGQQIIPLCYTIPAAVYRAEDAEHTASKEITWMDMLASQDEALSAAAVWVDDMMGDMKEGMPFITTRRAMTEFILGAVADYKEEALLFTEEELKQRLLEIRDLGERYAAGEFDTAPTHYVDYLGQKFDVPPFGQEYDVRNIIERTETYTLIPLYSDDGGVTAEISVYTAINRNSKRPDDAFRVLDYLCSYTSQRSDRVYTDIYSMGGLGGVGANIPMYNDLMSEEQRVYELNPVTDTSTTAWCLSDENFAELCEVREQITHVRFRNVLDVEFDKLCWDYLYSGDDEAERDKIVSEYYRKMQQMLRE